MSAELKFTLFKDGQKLASDKYEIEDPDKATVNEFIINTLEPIVQKSFPSFETTEIFFKDTSVQIPSSATMRSQFENYFATNAIAQIGIQGNVPETVEESEDIIDENNPFYEEKTINISSPKIISSKLFKDAKAFRKEVEKITEEQTRLLREASKTAYAIFTTQPCGFPNDKPKPDQNYSQIPAYFSYFEGSRCSELLQTMYNDIDKSGGNKKQIKENKPSLIDL